MLLDFYENVLRVVMCKLFNIYFDLLVLLIIFVDNIIKQLFYLF